MEKLSWKALKKRYPTRSPEAHKYDFGHVLVIGGAPGYSGSVRLAGESALRVGAGVVTIATHPDHAAFMNMARPELMSHGISSGKELKPLLAKASVIILGPGLGRESWGRELFQVVMQAALENQKPLILDADGLYFLGEARGLSGNTFLGQGKHWILTPHAGEAAKLLHQSREEVQKDRAMAVRELVDLYGSVSVLKGAGTLIASTQSSEIFINPVSNPFMSTAGMGDVLSGIIAGLVAQQCDLLTAAKLGVSLHSTSVEWVAKKQGARGILASDVWVGMKHCLNA